MVQKAMDVKVNIKPVYSNMVHSDVWEGPCRVGPRELLEPEYERRMGIEGVKRYKEELEKNLDLRYCNILEPVYVEWDESFVVRDAEMNKLLADIADTDVFLMTYRVPGIERFGKSISMISAGPTPLDIVGFYQDIGVDGFFADTYEDYNEQIKLRYIRKAVAHTKWLILSATEQITETGNSSVSDLYSLFQKYGIRNNRLPMAHIFQEMDKLSDTESQKELTDRLYDGAVMKNTIEKNFIDCDVRFYLAVKELMEQYDCNGFTISCKALCASKQPYQYKITPCLCHSLNKDLGIPSACEEDISALLTMTIFMYMTNKAIYMGNPVYIRPGSKTYGELGIPADNKKTQAVYPDELLELHHAVPSLKMAGLNQEDLPYFLGHFTQEGFGTKVQIDMAKEAPCKTVTIARFNRRGDRVIVTKAEILGTRFMEIYCSPANVFKLQGDVREFRQLLANSSAGGHLCMAYGDYVKEWQRLGHVMGFDVEYYHK